MAIVHPARRYKEPGIPQRMAMREAMAFTPVMPAGIAEATR
jgi:hypothetical protein